MPAHARPPLNPVWDLVSNHAKDLSLGILIIMSGTVMVYVVLLYADLHDADLSHRRPDRLPVQLYRLCGTDHRGSLQAVTSIGWELQRPLLFSIFAALIPISSDLLVPQRHAKPCGWRSPFSASC